MLYQFLISQRPLFFDGAMLLFRIFIGGCLIVHGLGKMGIVGPGNMAGFTGWLKSLGLPFPAAQARAAMISELLGGTMIVLGLGARLAAVICCVTMLVAAFFGHKGGGYLITNTPPGNEYALNLAVLMIVLFLLGPGLFSFDHLLASAH